MSQSPYLIERWKWSLGCWWPPSEGRSGSLGCWKLCANVPWELCSHVKSPGHGPCCLVTSDISDLEKFKRTCQSCGPPSWLCGHYFWEAGEGYSCCVTLSNYLPSLSLKDWTRFSSEPLPVHTGSSRAPVNREGSCGHSVPGSSSRLPPARNPAKWLCVFQPEDEKFPLTIEISRGKSWHTVGAQ